jgi:hypothetical protein
VKETQKLVILPLISGILAFGLGAYACSDEKTVEKTIPKIVTQYDTVEKTPEWLTDSLEIWRKQEFTTDKTNLIIENIIIRDVRIPVNSPPEQRPNIWPVLSINGGRIFGDTTFIRTFSVRSGHEAVSKLFTAGYITALSVELDSNSTPKITFTPFPPAEKHGFFHNPKVFGYGLVAGVGVCIVFC